MYLYYVLLILTFTIWGSLYFVSKIVLSDIPPFTVLLFRYLIALLAFCIAGQFGRNKKIAKTDLKYFCFIGICGYFGSIAFQLIGTKLLPSSTSALINALNPLTIPIFAALVLKEKLTIPKIMCVLLSLLGVFIIVGFGDKTLSLMGVFSCLLSVCLWSIASVVIRKISTKYSPLQITINSMMFALIPAVPFSIVETYAEPITIGWSSCCGLIYMGVFCTAIAQFMWNTCLANLEAFTCSAFYPLQIFFSMLFGWAILDEKLNVSFFIGALLITISILSALKITEKQTRKSYKSK